MASAKSVIAHFKQDGSLHYITIPLVLFGTKEWLTNDLCKQIEDKIQHNITEISNKPKIPFNEYQGVGFKILFILNQRINPKLIYVKPSVDNIVFEYSNEDLFLNNNVKTAVIKEIKQRLKKKLASLAKQMVHEEAVQLGFVYQNVRVNTAIRQYGSCDGKNISLSIYAFFLPEHLLRYVIRHELCHTKELNHSPHFWKLLEETTPQSEQYKKDIESLSRKIAWFKQ